MGHRPERVEQADGRGQLPPQEYIADLAQSVSRACTAFIRPFGTFQYIRMPFGLAKAGSVYSRILDVAMKEVDTGQGLLDVLP